MNYLGPKPACCTTAPSAPGGCTADSTALAWGVNAQVGLLNLCHPLRVALHPFHHAASDLRSSKLLFICSRRL